jgi:DNA-binding NtrC family response regulator
MASQYLRSVEQNSLAPAFSTRSEPRAFQHKIASIISIISSLNSAVEDLEVAPMPILNDDFDFYREVERFESGLIKSALRISNGSQVKAARLLKLNPTTLNAKMKTLKLVVK